MSGQIAKRKQATYDELYETVSHAPWGVILERPLRTRVRGGRRWDDPR